MKRVHIIVSGRVQGVFFRSNTRETASNLGLRGYARNLYNGDVEVVAEGNEEKLNKLIEFCKKGPESAHVTNIKIKYEKATNEFSDFEVRY